MIAKNEILEDIVNNLNGSKLEWNEVIDKFKQTSYYHGRKYNDHTLRSLL